VQGGVPVRRRVADDGLLEELSKQPAREVERREQRPGARIDDTWSMAMHKDELLAKVFVDTRAVDELAQHLATRFHGQLDGLPEARTVATPVLTLDVMRNEDRPRSHLYLSDNDSFLFFPCVVEAFTAAESDAASAVIPAIAEVLGVLDELGLHYVTASDFEDDLPNAGRSRLTI
jgi:hypothetical protein